ncbi:DUF3084 domain-containing protein [Nodosilinea sp. LEGE 07298]|uniref:DUF3084 domain-containing protein n=1 Tax=Nodosilinea sp. LEGE 07298 TaxID=2777970 RepID=UPI001880E53E|nr:DUF3084 domain-containing protein [Nodosilinea sp. LEGE 07298]MBE9111024.1 DUF3084 domain-containing protein [Nodosilinea sp. LEGE 07298]
MVSGYVLIFAVLMLGGVIATLGDRIGMRVGKARLSLFNLRPRQTATVVSIATGSIISASTLALLFGVSSQLRTGVFELGRIQDDLASAEADLAEAQSTQENVEADLEAATDERQRALGRLQEVNESLNRAVEQQESTESELRQTLGQLDTVSQQAETLRQSTATLRVERDRLLQQQATISSQIAQRDQQIAQLDQQIAQRDQQIAQREQLLESLEAQQDFLEQQVAALQTQYQGLFRGNIALNRNQEILTGQGRAETRAQAEEFVTEFLQEANRIVFRAIAPGTPIDQQILLIGNREVEALIERLATGEDYVVRLLSAANYITGEPCVLQQGEPCIQVFIDATPNQQIYAQGERLATVALDPPPFEDRQLVERLNLLLAATQFRARQDGVVIDDNLQVADNRSETILNFLEAVQQSGQAVDLQAIAAADIFTAGPVQINLAAVRDGQTLFQTSVTPTWLENESDRPGFDGR